MQGGFLFTFFSAMKLLSQSSRRVVNKNLAKIVWIDASLLLSYLCDQNEYYQSTGQLVAWKKNQDKMFFFCTQPTIEEQTTLTRKPTQSAIKKLSDLWLIVVEKIWVPAKNHFWINEKKILEVTNSTNKIVPKAHTSMSQKDKLDSTKGTVTNNIYKEINNNNIDTNIITATDVAEPSKQKNMLLENFTPHEPPRENKSNPEINEIIEMIQNTLSSVWMVYKPKSQKTDNWKTVTDRMILSTLLRSKIFKETIETYKTTPIEYLQKIIECWLQDKRYATKLSDCRWLARYRQEIHNKKVSEDLFDKRKNSLSNQSR